MREPSKYEAPLCAQVGSDIWFPDQGTDNTQILRAKRICGSCIHRVECAEWGIYRERHGIWGGLTALERKLARRRLKIVLPREESA